eukprot:TRINITY_DN74154_c0_g1_i1.p1 TRINITY_DN74154_c0_g1~~TRINITY_DN74154_c0_g1_i1.p1  ORF type:complete len:266 (-),score=43.12 TRINITY_DN74154_c0_g1_i1:229-918(-)
MATMGTSPMYQTQPFLPSAVSNPAMTYGAPAVVLQAPPVVTSVVTAPPVYSRQMEVPVMTTVPSLSPMNGMPPPMQGMPPPPPGPMTYGAPNPSSFSNLDTSMSLAARHEHGQYSDMVMHQHEEAALKTNQALAAAQSELQKNPAEQAHFNLARKGLELCIQELVERQKDTWRQLEFIKSQVNMNYQVIEQVRAEFRNLPNSQYGHLGQGSQPAHGSVVQQGHPGHPGK